MYNPPQILAEELAKIMNLTVKADILIKSKWTKAQTFLSKRQRKNNISGSIKFNTKYNILGKKILLIDDVITTGETIMPHITQYLKFEDSSVKIAGSNIDHH
ncbi:ComF family protein [Rickettsia endosymbiont of Gonocerus acuteangulatus]|uniref:ComF family protein n=1 Tax=Rickettsia endosymbiont of Gonocerus acuteangulatus TaxID=3066266 RepID=UPI00397DAB50